MNDHTEKMTPAEITQALNRVHDSTDRHRVNAVLLHLAWLTLAKAEW